MKLLKRLLGRGDAAPPETGLPYSVTRAEAADIRLMTSSEGWKALMGAVERMTEQQAEGLLAATSTPRMHFLRGLIQGARWVALMPTIIQQSADDDTSERRTLERARNDSDRRSIALFGTAWGGKHADTR